MGVDIISIERMQKAVGKWGARFLQRIFTADEITYCYQKRNPFPSLSVRFAAKEAFIKAAGGATLFPLTDIEVVRDDNGRPALRLKGKAGRFIELSAVEYMHLSLSHEKEYGIACVALERDTEKQVTVR